jgi:DNA-directed RNA polymerase specialized sigma24 family protein
LEALRSREVCSLERVPEESLGRAAGMARPFLHACKLAARQPLEGKGSEMALPKRASDKELTVSQARRLLQRIETVNSAFRSLEQERRQLMLRANDGGVSTREIADRTGESRGSVAHWIRTARANQPDAPEADPSDQ